MSATLSRARRNTGLAALIIAVAAGGWQALTAADSVPKCSEIPMPLRLIARIIADRLSGDAANWIVVPHCDGPSPLTWEEVKKIQLEQPSRPLVIVTSDEEGRPLDRLQEVSTGSAKRPPKRPTGFLKWIHDVTVGADTIVPILWTNAAGNAAAAQLQSAMSDGYFAALVSNVADGPCDMPDVFDFFIMTANIAPSNTYPHAAWLEYDELKKSQQTARPTPDYDNVVAGLQDQLKQELRSATAPPCQARRASFLQGPNPALSLATQYQTAAADAIRAAASALLDVEGATPTQGDAYRTQANKSLALARQCLYLALSTEKRPRCRAPNRGLWTSAYVPALHAAVEAALLQKGAVK